MDNRRVDFAMHVPQDLGYACKGDFPSATVFYVRCTYEEFQRIASGVVSEGYEVWYNYVPAVAGTYHYHIVVVELSAYADGVAGCILYTV